MIIQINADFFLDMTCPCAEKSLNGQHCKRLPYFSDVYYSAQGWNSMQNANESYTEIAEHSF